MHFINNETVLGYRFYFFKVEHSLQLYYSNVKSKLWLPAKEHSNTK